MNDDTRTSLATVRRELEALANPADAVFLQRFFRTGPGEYGEGDRFLGIRVPVIRRLVRQYRELPLKSVISLLHSPWHEARLLALLLWVEQYRRGGPAEREAIHQAYLANTRRINNWDLVDTSAEHIVGAHVAPADISLLVRLAHSVSLWERRIAILATFHWIRRGESGPALRIAEMLLRDPHDLIHKATGWMLREVGKRDQERAEEFLRVHAATMPRTMLRYAIERFPEPLRLQYLKTPSTRSPA
jgi:3-methyladenine DNA glycosylase AlkD